MYLYMLLIYMSLCVIFKVSPFHVYCYFFHTKKKNPLFKIPASVAAKIERLQRDFLWLGKVKEIILLVGM